MTIPLPNFKNARILVIGDIMLDRYWSGSATRISPEAPVPVVKVGAMEDRLGGAANVAKNLASLGCQVAVCGIIGNDSAGVSVRKLIAESAIFDHIIADTTNPTITKLRVLSRHQQLLRLDFEECLISTANQNLANEVEKALPGYDAVIISDYAKGTVTNPQEVIEICNSHGVTIFVDPKASDFSRYRGASYITPNLSELEGVMGKCTSLEDMFCKAESLREKIVLEGVLVTLSEKGMALIRKGDPPLHMQTTAKDVFDVTGAGDTVIATLAAAHAAGSDIHNAVRLANLAAGVVVGKLGTSSVTAEELKAALDEEDKALAKGAVTLNTLIEQINLCRRKGEKIVFTNGCFDILHAGHVRYLKQAASLGDRLVVGMNSDTSISRLKGPQRPIVALAERMEVISSLNCVDWVIPFEDDTPAELIQKILPDILAKGGDYVAKHIVGYDTVTQNGGKVVVLPFVEGCSTTSIVEKIRHL